MARNFDFVKEAGWVDLHRICDRAEQEQKTNPTSSAINSRKALEQTVSYIFFLKGWPYDDFPGLYERTVWPTFSTYVGDDMMRRISYVRRIGNRAAHEADGVASGQSFYSLLDLHYIVANLFVKLKLLDEVPEFNRALIPGQADNIFVPQPQVQPVAPVVAEHQGELDTPMVTHPQPNVSEEETRKRYIDLLLEEAGWTVDKERGKTIPHHAGIEIEVSGMPTPTGTGKADYVLFGADGRALAVVEAKKTTVDAVKGEEQAILYAASLERRYGQKPVIFLTNGYTIDVIDGTYPKHRIYAFYTEDDLVKTLAQRNRRIITDADINHSIIEREYQVRSIHALADRYNRKNRKALLVMATGTGKTRVSIAAVDVLIKSGWVHKVLFLADRISLVNQAKRAYENFLPNLTKTVLSEDKHPDMNAEITFSTYQTMIHYVNEEQKQFSVKRFDLVIVDEAHRSIFGKYKSIVDYFDSLLIGMTATPRSDVDRSTYDLFDCETGEPTFTYELEEAVRDKFLKYFKVIDRTTDLMKQGRKYSDMTKDEQEQMDEIAAREAARLNLDPDDDEEAGRDLYSNELFNYLFNTNTVDLVLKTLMEEGHTVDDGDSLGKTIIFAFNHKHAELIVERFGKLYPELGHEYCQLIDTYEKYADERLRKFAETPFPRIAVSVDMLDTGVDVPSILNLVFFKKVMSKIRFWQMIGRGTRLCPEIGKEDFLIFDWCGNFDFFDLHPEGKKDVRMPSLTERLFNLRMEIMVALQAANYQEDPAAVAIYNNIKAKLIEQVKGLNTSRIDVRQNIELIDKFRDEAAWVNVNPVDARKLETDVAPLLAPDQDEINAKRFDLLMLTIQLRMITAPDTDTTFLDRKVIRVAEELEKKASIPQVMQAMPTIREVQTEAFWQPKHLDRLEHARKELRNLMRYLDGISETFVISISDEVIIKPGHTTTVVPRMSYRNRVEEFLAANEHNYVMVKIKSLKQITEEDMDYLQRKFWEELGTKDEYDEIANAKARDNVAVFIRKSLHVDYDEALRMFTELISINVLTPDQESYLKALITYVNENGDILLDDLQIGLLGRYELGRIFGDKTPYIRTYVETLHRVITAA